MMSPCNKYGKGLKNSLASPHTHGRFLSQNDILP